MKEERKTLVQAFGILTDLVIFLLSMAIVVTFFDNIVIKLTDELTEEMLAYYILMIISALFTFVCFEDYQQIFKRTLTDEVIDCVRINCMFLAISAILLIVTKNPMVSSRYVFISVYILNLVFGVIERRLFKYLMQKHLNERMGASLVGILTTYDRTEEIIMEITSDWTRHIQGMAIIDKEMTGDMVDDIDVVASGLEEFAEWAERQALDEIIVDVPYNDNEVKTQLKQFIEKIKKTGVAVHFNTAMLNEFSEYYCSVTYFGHTPMLTFENTHYNYNKMILKRGIDIIGGLIGCIISIPIICIVAVPLLIESKGPLFFKQKRVGLNGRYFYMYKLRSMYANAEEQKKELMAQNEVQGLMFKMSNDPRITKVGKFIRKTSIDELPQFFNVLKGDMSLVGTRPPTIDEFQQYEGYHKRRLSMKPGISGMWQISGRSDIDNFEDVVRMDLIYIDNWSVSLDIRILLKTVMVVLGKNGAK